MMQRAHVFSVPESHESAPRAPSWGNFSRELVSCGWFIRRQVDSGDSDCDSLGIRQRRKIVNLCFVFTRDSLLKIVIILNLQTFYCCCFKVLILEGHGYNHKNYSFFRCRRGACYRTIWSRLKNIWLRGCRSRPVTGPSSWQVSNLRWNSIELRGKVFCEEVKDQIFNKATFILKNFWLLLLVGFR